MSTRTALAVAILPACLLFGSVAGEQRDANRQRVRITSSAAARVRRRSRSEDSEFNELAPGFVAYGFGGRDYHPTRDNPRFTLEVRFMSRAQAIDACRALGAWGDRLPPRSEGGCALFYPDREPLPHCVVIVPEPVDTDDAATAVLGHEVLHCARGPYHD